MQWELSLTSQSQQDCRLLFNKMSKYSLSFCVIVFGVLIICGCSDSNYQNERAIEREVEFSASNQESKPNEYIIVLSENVSIENAISNLQKYDAKVIKSLERGRYLIELKNDPGIEQLILDVSDTKDIVHIQTNFTYTIQ